MHCLHTFHVLSTRTNIDGTRVTRRLECTGCGHRQSTINTPVPKDNGGRPPHPQYNVIAQKLRAGEKPTQVARALGVTKRVVDTVSAQVRQTATFS